MTSDQLSTRNRTDELSNREPFETTRKTEAIIAEFQLLEAFCETFGKCRKISKKLAMQKLPHSRPEVVKVVDRCEKRRTEESWQLRGTTLAAFARRLRLADRGPESEGKDGAFQIQMHLFVQNTPSRNSLGTRGCCRSLGRHRPSSSVRAGLLPHLLVSVLVCSSVCQSAQLGLHLLEEILGMSFYR